MRIISVIILSFVFTGIFAQDNWQQGYLSTKKAFNDQDLKKALNIIKNMDGKFSPEKNHNYYELKLIEGLCRLQTEGNDAGIKPLMEVANHYTLEKSHANHFTAVNYLGMLLLNKKDYSEAIKWFDVTIAVAIKQQKPPKTLAGIYKNLGTVHFITGTYSAAINNYLKRIDQLKKSNQGYQDLAQAYADLGQSYFSNGDYTNACKYYDQAIRHPANQSIIQKFYSKRAIAYVYTKDFETAHKAYTDLTAFVESSFTQRSWPYCETLLDHALFLKLFNKEHAALSMIEKAFEAAKTADLSKTELTARILASRGDIERNLGYFNQAETSFQEAYKIYGRISTKEHKAYGRFLNGYALLLDELGLFDDAEHFYKKDLELIVKYGGKNSLEHSQSMSNLGLLYINMAKYGQAESILLEAKAMRDQSVGRNHPKYHESLNNLALLSTKLGQLDKAKTNYRTAIELMKKSNQKDPLAYGTALTNFASLHEKDGNYTDAISYYEEALEILSASIGKDHIAYASVLNNMALAYHYEGDDQRALNLFDQYLRTVEQAVGSSHPSYATGLINLGLQNERIEKYDNALGYYNKALNIRKSTYGTKHPLYTKLMHNIARIQVVKKNYNEADKLWTAICTNYLEEIDNHFPYLSEKEKRQFYYEIKDEFEQFNTYAILRQPENPALLGIMYNNQLATKALLLHARKKVRSIISESGNDALVKKYDEWQHLREVYANVYKLPSEELKQKGIDLESLGNLIETLEKELSSSSSEFKRSRERKKATWTAIRKSLKPDEVAIELLQLDVYNFKKGGTYTTNESHYIALIVSSETKKAPHYVHITNGHELEGRLANYYRNATEFRMKDLYSYENYWLPIKKGIGSASTVYFSADKVYHKINLNGLRNEETGHFLLDEINLHNVTSTSELLENKPLLGAKHNIVLIGDPEFNYTHEQHEHKIDHLPGTNKEVISIKNMIDQKGWDVELNTGKIADEEHVKEAVNPTVLHIATHGFFNVVPENTTEEASKYYASPLLQSGLYFAGAEETINNLDIDQTKTEDGILTAYEAMNMNLSSTELVVLSACETGLGSTRNGESVYGLQRAFKEAGAKSLIISLWKVNDQTTQELMTNFYANWLTSMNKKEAFKQAQIQLREKYPEPFYWSAFIMVGI